MKGPVPKLNFYWRMKIGSAYLISLVNRNVATFYDFTFAFPRPIHIKIVFFFVSDSKPRTKLICAYEIV